MTPYWKEWKEIVVRARNGNGLAMVALRNLVDALHEHDHRTSPFDFRKRGGYIQNWLEQQDFLHKSVMMVTCKHTFLPDEETPGFLRCAFCGNNVHKDVIARWKEQGWIRLSRYHEWSWEPGGRDKHGAILKRGTCKLCKHDLGVERFCVYCGRKLETPETGPECDDCIREMEHRMAQREEL